MLQITITTKDVGANSFSQGLLKVTYPKFPAMCQEGDTIFLGKYLVTGSEDSSLYLTVICPLLTPRHHQSLCITTCIFSKTRCCLGT